MCIYIYIFDPGHGFHVFVCKSVLMIVKSIGRKSPFAMSCRKVRNQGRLGKPAQHLAGKDAAFGQEARAGAGKGGGDRFQGLSVRFRDKPEETVPGSLFLVGVQTAGVNQDRFKQWKVKRTAPKSKRNNVYCAFWVGFFECAGSGRHTAMEMFGDP